VARPQENGTCESAHGHLKRRIQQHLLLRESRDFASEAEYDAFLIGALESANELRRARVSVLPDDRELMVTVGNNSTIRLRKQVYSVPSRLIGAKLLARIYENRVVLPESRTLSSLDESLLPLKVRRALPSLIEGCFVDRAVNVLALGMPGRGRHTSSPRWGGNSFCVIPSGCSPARLQTGRAVAGRQARSTVGGGTQKTRPL
jgi:hypothetical protein